MIRTLPLGLDEARALTLDHIQPLPAIQVDLLDGQCQALSEDIYALVDSPSIDASLRDGFAVISDEVASASPEHPVSLKLNGIVGAGDMVDARVVPGTAVQILTGAKIPPGANAVV